MKQKDLVIIAIFCLYLGLGDIAQRLGFGLHFQWADPVLIPAIAVLAVKFRNSESSARQDGLGFLTKIFFVLGALCLGLILKGFWFDFLRSFPTNTPDQFIDPMVFREKPEERSAMANFWMIIWTPVKEEILFRFCLLGSLFVFFRKSPALILSSLIFAVMHYKVYPVTMVMPLFVIGIFLGIVYMILGLGWSILMHIMINSSGIWIPKLASDKIIFLSFAPFAVTAMCIFLYRLVRHRRSLFW